MPGVTRARDPRVPFAVSRLQRVLFKLCHVGPQRKGELHAVRQKPIVGEVQSHSCLYDMIV